MTDTTKTLIACIAVKLSLDAKTVKRWVKSNGYSVDQLLFIEKQISLNEIPIPKLISAIVNNSEYRISIY